MISVSFITTSGALTTNIPPPSRAEVPGKKVVFSLILQPDIYKEESTLYIPAPSSAVFSDIIEFFNVNDESSEKMAPPPRQVAQPLSPRVPVPPVRVTFSTVMSITSSHFMTDASKPVPSITVSSEEPPVRIV